MSFVDMGKGKRLVKHVEGKDTMTEAKVNSLSAQIPLQRGFGTILSVSVSTALPASTPLILT